MKEAEQIEAQIRAKGSGGGPSPGQPQPQPQTYVSQGYYQPQQVSGGNGGNVLPFFQFLQNLYLLI